MIFLKKKQNETHEKIKIKRLKEECKHIAKKLIELKKTEHFSHCVLVIGQPESGKSTLCSSLEARNLSRKSNVLTDNKSLHSFGIFLHKETIFLDIPPSFFLFSDIKTTKQLWSFLSKELKKYQPYLNITHCIACIDTQDVLTRNKISNDSRLSHISLALNTITSALKSTLNTSFFFTKLDLIPGFVEFFEHESKEFLEQAWGLSLEKTNKEDLSIEFEEIIKKLNDRLIFTLHQEIHIENLHLIKSFPIAMEALKKKLIEILPNFFTQSNKNQYIQFSCLYFCSCQQYKELTEPQDSKNKITENDYIHQNHINFFIKQALEKQSQYYNTHYSIIEKYIQSLFVILCILFLTAFIFYHSQQFSTHIKFIQSTNKIIESAWSFSKKPYSELDPKDIIFQLKIIRENWELIEKDENSSLIENYIFNKNTKIESQLQNLYQKIINQQWIPLIKQKLKNYINENLSSSPEKAYIAFSIYCMLTQENIPIDTKYIKNHIGNILGDSFASEIPISDHIQKSHFVIDENNTFIQKTRSYFKALPTNTLAYILFYSSLDPNHYIDLSSQLKTETVFLKDDVLFSHIPEIYTATFFDEIYTQRLPAIVDETINGNLLLGIEKRNETDDLKNKLLMQLQKDYLKLYSNAWEEAIQHVEIKSSTSLSELALQIKTLTSVHSPILSLLTLSQVNTSIPQIEENSEFLTTFNQTLTKQSTPENNALYRTFSLLIRLEKKINQNEIHPQGKINLCALLASENMSTTQNTTEAKQISLLATQLPQPIQSWIQEIVENYDHLLKEEASDC